MFVDKQLKVFWGKLFFLIFPVILFLGFPFLVLFSSGELADINEIIDLQKNENQLILYGPAYVNRAIPFKVQAAISRFPSILALGTSRVMQFRSQFFRNPTTFYNAGGAIEKIGDLRNFFEALPKVNKLQIIILGLDQDFFHATWELRAKSHFSVDISPSEVLINQAKFVLMDYFSGKFSFGKIWANQYSTSGRIGVNAIENSGGFRNDGSYRYGRNYIQKLEESGDQNLVFKSVLDLIETGKDRFEYGNSINGDAVIELDRILTDLKKKNILVVGFLPPFAHAVFSKVVSLGDKYSYIPKIFPTLQPIFFKKGFPLFDFSDIEWCGSSDKEAIDGFHGSERTYLKIFLRILENSEIMNNLAVQESFLRERLSGASGTFSVFEN